MMKRVAVLTLSLTVALAAMVSAQSGAGQAGAKPAAARLMAAVQGAWTMTTQNGQDMAGSGQDVVVTITDNKYVQTVNGQVVERGTFKIDEAKKPAALEIQVSEGENAGKTQFGALSVDGKTMTVKLAEPGATTKPTDLAVAEGFLVLTMVKK